MDNDEFCIKDYEGSKYNIIHCDGAIDSFNEVVKEHQNKCDQYTAQMIALIKRLGDGHRMSNENFPKEGELPDGSYFRALKKIPIRAYIWLSKKTPNTYYVSHYIYKKCQKLKKSDTKKVCDNWKKMELTHDEQ